MTKLADGLRLDALFPHPERLVPFLGNHDTTRFFNDPNATPQKLQLAFTLLTTMRGMPQIYSGDEIAMRGGEDPDNRRDFPGGFPSVSGQPQAQTFPPENLTPEQRQTFDNVKALLAIRRSHPALQDGEEQILHADNDTLVYVRSTRTPSGVTQRVLIALNKGIQSENTSLDITGTTLNDTRSASMLVGDSNSIRLADHKLILRVAPESAVIATIE
jgi:glycosidase